MQRLPADYELKYDSRQIAGGVASIAEAVGAWAADYEERQLVAIVILRGAMPFFIDLVRALPISIDWSFVQAKAYEERDNGVLREKVEVHIEQAQVRGRVVLLVDDICDSGRTLKALHAALRSAGAAEVKTAVLLRRERATRVFDPDWHAFSYAGDEWFVGYGMDDNGRYRELPEIYLKRDLAGVQAGK